MNMKFFVMLFLCLVVSGIMLGFLVKDIDPKTAEVRLGVGSEKIIIINIIKKEKPTFRFYYIPNTEKMEYRKQKKIRI